MTIRAENISIKSFGFDISDLLVYTMHHRNVSGIQRVQANLTYSILSGLGGHLLTDGAEIAFVNFDYTSGRINQLSKKLLIEYISLLRDVETSHQVVKSFILDMVTHATPWHSDCHSAYIVTGAFWMFANAPILYNELKRSGCIVGCLIYDLIPISHPEFCDAGLVATFQASIDSGLPFFDLILTISEYTAKEVLRYIERSNGRSTIIIPVPLAHSIHDKPHAAELPYSELQRAKFNDYVLCVGTIEARKNHTYLFQVWKLLIENETKNIPKLVIVGRWGWRVADLQQQLEASGYLSNHVVVFSEVDDALLEVLYKNCMFTILTSFVEGWGLPVGESLTHGKLCIASNTSSIPEVGGGFVDYIDPYNARQGFEKIAGIISNRDTLIQHERRIKNDFKQRTWAQVADDFIKAIYEAVSHKDFVVGESFEFAVVIGSVVEANTEASRPSGARSPAVTPFQSGWHVAENFGRWIAGRQACLRFKLIGLAPVSTVAKLDLVSVPWAASNLLTIVINGDSHTHQIPGGERFVLVHKITPASNGIVECLISIEGDIENSLDERGLSVGIERFSIYSSAS